LARMRTFPSRPRAGLNAFLDDHGPRFGVSVVAVVREGAS
jgi:hypothetical protein